MFLLLGAKSAATTPPQSGLVRQWLGGEPGDPWRSSAAPSRPGAGPGQPRLHRDAAVVLRDPDPDPDPYCAVHFQVAFPSCEREGETPQSGSRQHGHGTLTNTFLDRHACLVAVGGVPCRAGPIGGCRGCCCVRVALPGQPLRGAGSTGGRKPEKGRGARQREPANNLEERRERAHSALLAIGTVPRLVAPFSLPTPQSHSAPVRRWAKEIKIILGQPPPSSPS